MSERINHEVGKYSEVALSVVQVHECGIVGKEKAIGVWTATIINS